MMEPRGTDPLVEQERWSSYGHAQRDNAIEEIKRLDALLEYAVMHGEEEEAEEPRGPDPIGGVEVVEQLWLCNRKTMRLGGRRADNR